jgi:hypothetical protein
MLPAAWRGNQAQLNSPGSGVSASGSSGAGGSGSGSGAGGSATAAARSASLGDLLAEAGAHPVLAKPGSSVFRGHGWFY